VLQGEPDVLYRDWEIFANDGSAPAIYTQGLVGDESNPIFSIRQVLPFSYLKSCGSDSPPSIKQVKHNSWPLSYTLWFEVTFTCAADGVEDVAIAGGYFNDTVPTTTVAITGEVNTISR